MRTHQFTCNLSPLSLFSTTAISENKAADRKQERAIAILLFYLNQQIEKIRLVEVFLRHGNHYKLIYPSHMFSASPPYAVYVPSKGMIMNFQGTAPPIRQPL